MVFFIFVSVVMCIYGTIIGSFLNVVIYRTPKKEQVVKGRSRCMSCSHVLAWYDLFPVISWICLGGKCRYCKVKVSPRYAIVESLCGISYAIAFLALGLSINLVFAVVLFPILICLSFLDIDTGEIEYIFPISIAALGIIAMGLSLFGVTDIPWHEHLIGAIAISIPFAVLALFGAMGGADIQLMAAAGLLLGWNIIPAALIGVFSGAIVGAVFKATDKHVYKSEDALPAKGTAIPFGPFLAVGIAAAYLYGDKMIAWYLGLMG
ncbi:MAG: prepilin peptidase [Oscillospiraceae bacterium]|nr:prepilin peptidase [Oscillospiraceae bacterium]